MNANQSIGRTIGVSLLVAVVLMLVPLPIWAAKMRPDFIILTLMYWWLAHPEKIGIFYGLLMGLLLDVLYSSLMGQHAVGYVIVAWVFIKNHQKIRTLPLSQQSITVFFLLLVKQFISFWIDVIRGHQSIGVLLYFSSCVIGALLWPYVFQLLRLMRRRAKNKKKPS